MNKIKNISIIVLILITLVFGYLLFKKKDPKTITKKILIEVPVPGKIGTFDPVEMPVPKKEKPRPKLEEKFSKADSITKDSLYRDAITEREYEQVFKDSTQEVTVSTKVQGKILSQSLSYEIYKDTITTGVDVTIPISQFKKNKYFGTYEIGVDIDNPISVPVIKGGIMLVTKKDKVYNISIDSKKRAWLGGAIKF